MAGFGFLTCTILKVVELITLIIEKKKTPNN